MKDFYRALLVVFLVSLIQGEFQQEEDDRYIDHDDDYYVDPYSDYSNIDDYQEYNNVEDYDYDYARPPIRRRITAKSGHNSRKKKRTKIIIKRKKPKKSNVISVRKGMYVFGGTAMYGKFKI